MLEQKFQNQVNIDIGMYDKSSIDLNETIICVTIHDY